MSGLGPRRAHFVACVLTIYFCIIGELVFSLLVTKTSIETSLPTLATTALIFLPFLQAGYTILKIRNGDNEKLEDLKLKADASRLGSVLAKLVVLVGITVITSLFAVTLFIRNGVCASGLVLAGVALVSNFLLIDPAKKMLAKMLL